MNSHFGAATGANAEGTGVEIPVFETKEQLIDLASELERRAARRFRLMAERARAEARDDLAQLFENLAEEEDRHLDRTTTLNESSQTPREPETATWLQSAFPISDGPDAAEFGRLSLYACLAEAVRNEEKAFAFFSHVAGNTTLPALKTLAEELAVEELQHAHRLRQARRKAYRLPEKAVTFWPNAIGIKSEQELLSMAAQGEAAFLRFLAGLELPEALMVQVREMAEQALPSHDLTHQESSKPPESAGAHSTSDARHAIRAAEEAFAFYDAVLTQAATHDMMLRAQALSKMALARLKLFCSTLAAPASDT